MITIGSTDLALRAEARRVTETGVARSRRSAAHPEDPLPAAPLPLHLADRAHREPRPAAPAGELRPRAGARRPGCSAARSLIEHRAARLPRRAASARLDSRTVDDRPRPPRTTSRSVTTTSRRRATPAIEPRRDGVWVADVGSTNGTYVNGAKLDEAASPGARRCRPRRRAPTSATNDEAHAARRGHRSRPPAAAQRGRVRRRSRRCSRSPTGWAARRPARSPRGSRPSCSRDSAGGTGEDAVVALIQEANRRVYEAAATRRGAGRAWARR